MTDLDENRVLRFNGTTGARKQDFVPAGSGGLVEPGGLAFGPDGNLYVASGGAGQILRYDGRTGAPLGVFAQGGGMRGPLYLLFGP